jgi:hypothetical protein
LNVKLPARYVDDRIFVHPVTANGTELSFYSDTGGGGSCLHRSAVERLGLKPFKRRMGDQEHDFVSPPPFREDAALPLGAHLEGFIVADAIFGDQDGFLGMWWFADGVWRFDYINEELWLLDGYVASFAEQQQACPLGFARTADGRRRASYPRISADVDGAILEFLFDTGATVSLTPRAKAAMQPLDGGSLRGTSFITNTVFEGWRRQHPDWHVIEHADRTMDEAMIRVPSVHVAGCDAGPVWFVRRPDTNFHNYMSQWMDRRIDGAIGGSFLKYFTVTVDYPNAVAYFAR